MQGQIWIVVNIANFAYWSIIFYPNIDVWIKESYNKARIFLGRNYMHLLYVFIGGGLGAVCRLRRIYNIFILQHGNLDFDKMT